MVDHLAVRLEPVRGSERLVGQFMAPVLRVRLGPARGLELRDLRVASSPDAVTIPNAVSPALAP